MGFSLPERLRAAADAADEEAGSEAEAQVRIDEHFVDDDDDDGADAAIVGFPFGCEDDDHEEGCENGAGDDDDDDDDDGDDRAGELLRFLMDLQATAMESFGFRGDAEEDHRNDHGTRTIHPTTAADRVEFDPKLYVDLPLRGALDATKAAFLALPRTPTGSVSPEKLKGFVREYFYEAGSDLVAHTPIDYLPDPPEFLARVRNADAREWGTKVHSLWPSLARLVSPEVEREPDRHTLLPLKHPFIVPGERFREVYYWDSYWVIRGLLASKMMVTASGIVDNFLSIVQSHGFVPNGTRTYYENRSQPPLLSRMVRAIFSESGDLSLATKALPLLVQEYQFWTTEPHEVVIRDGQGRVHRLSRYSAHWDQPRPECSTIDKSIAGGFSKLKQLQLYRDIATGAESGWDFSSRWMGDEENLSTMKSSSIIPVDLNAFLLQMECDIAFLAKALNDVSVSKHFTRAADARRRAFEAILWNGSMGQWLDYWLPLRKPADMPKNMYMWDSSRSNRNIYASNFVPLWCSIFSPGDSRIDQVVEALSSSGLVQLAGIATSLMETGQQWDFPNAWAPLQHMIIEGLVMSGSRKARALAMSVTRAWLQSNYAAFLTSGHMLEKYDARYCGEVGGGGEYTTQTGFGWTNGVVLALLDDYGWPEELRLDCTSAT